LLQRAQDLRQWAGAQLRASAGAGRERREADLIACEHDVSLGTIPRVGRSRSRRRHDQLIPGEVFVAATDSEAVAEAFAARLRAERIRSRISYDSPVGLPRQIAPSGLGFGPGAFRVTVAERDAERARELLAEAGDAPVRSRPVLRVIAAVLLIAFLLTWIPATIELLRLAFSR
jgi:hypothetical protein